MQTWQVLIRDSHKEWHESCCRLTSYNTPTYHNRDTKYYLPSQENPVWKKAWQVLIFCTSGGLPNPHLLHAMGSVPQEGNSGLLKMKNNESKLHYWYLSFCHLVWYIFTTISEKNVAFFDHDSMLLQNVGKCIPHIVYCHENLKSYNKTKLFTIQSTQKRQSAKIIKS